MGNGEYGQLGHRNKNDLSLPKKVENLAQKRIEAMAIGMYHTLIVAKGELYACGKGIHGQLGDGTTHKKKEFTRVESLRGKTIQAIAAGSDFTVIVANNEVYTFGEGSFGQLGYTVPPSPLNEGFHLQLLPKKINALSGKIKMAGWWLPNEEDLINNDDDRKLNHRPQRGHIVFVGCLLDRWSLLIHHSINTMLVDLFSYFPNIPTK